MNETLNTGEQQPISISSVLSSDTGSGSSDDSSTDDTAKRLQPYAFRQRPRHDCSGASIFNGCELPDLADVTLGHPTARGCKGCFAKREDYPLLEEGSRDPCVICQADDIDCELIMQPARKRAYEAYSKRRFVYSYREEGGDHAQPCIECAKAGSKCIAGPLSGRTRTGPSLDQNWPTMACQLKAGLQHNSVLHSQSYYATLYRTETHHLQYWLAGPGPLMKRTMFH